MFRKLVKVTEIEIEGQRYSARYYEEKTLRGSRRFSCEVTIDASASSQFVSALLLAAPATTTASTCATSASRCRRSPTSR